MTQEPLNFDATIAEIVHDSHRREQARELERVTRGIGAHILAFFRWKGINAEFFSSELNDYVCLKTARHVAPGSSDRVMRDMRMKRLLDYDLVSRSQSLYRITKI